MRPVRKADKLKSPCAVVMKSGNLNFLEPSGPLQACNGTDLFLPLCVYIHSIDFKGIYKGYRIFYKRKQTNVLFVLYLRSIRTKLNHGNIIVLMIKMT